VLYQFNLASPHLVQDFGVSQRQNARGEAADAGHERGLQPVLLPQLVKCVCGRADEKAGEGPGKERVTQQAGRGGCSL